MASAHHSAPPPQAKAHGHQRIRRLDEKVAAQVWATVVLSSVDQVLAQLVYNSLDAGATIIQAALDPAALWLSVTDNGIGILPADLPLLGMSSHSSKSPPAHQVDSAAARPPSYPRYHGYRGQAFAALTTVALVQVSSKHESSSVRSRRTFATSFPLASRPAVPEPMNHPLSFSATEQPGPSGTTVICSDMFFNVPVRRNMWQPRDILQQARSFIERIAVAYPTVAFSLHDCRTQKLVVTVPPCPTSIDTLRHLSGASAVPPDKCHSFATTISNPFSPIAISGWWFNTRFPQGLAFVNREPCLDAPLHTILVRLLESRFQAVDFGFICLIRCSREISLDITRLRLIISSSLDTQLNPSPPNSAPSMAASRPSTSPLTAYPHSFTLSDTSSRPHSCSTTFFQPPRLPLRKAQSSGTICESAGRSRSSIRRLGRSASGGRLDDGPPPGFTQLASVFIDPRTGNSVFATSPARHDSSASSASASHSLYSPRSRESRPRSTPSRDGSTASSTVSKTSAASTTAVSLQATRLAIESVVSHASSQHTSTLSSRFFRVARQVATPLSILGHSTRPRDMPLSRSDIADPFRSRVIAQVDSKFILVSVTMADRATALIAVDQHAADERVRLEELLAQADREINEHGGLAMTPLAEVLVMGDVPVHVARVFRERREWLMRWGIWAEEEEVQAQADETCPAPSSIFVRAIPTLVTSRLARDPSSITDLIFALLAEPHESTLIQTSTPPPPVLHMLHSIACRSAIMFGDPLTLEAGELLWRALTQTRYPFQCAHGRPSMVPLLVVPSIDFAPGLSRTVERSDWGRGGAASCAPNAHRRKRRRLTVASRPLTMVSTLVPCFKDPKDNLVGHVQQQCNRAHIDPCRNLGSRRDKPNRHAGPRNHQPAQLGMRHDDFRHDVFPVIVRRLDQQVVARCCLDRKLGHRHYATSIGRHNIHDLVIVLPVGQIRARERIQVNAPEQRTLGFGHAQPFARVWVANGRVPGCQAVFMVDFVHGATCRGITHCVCDFETNWSTRRRRDVHWVNDDERVGGKVVGDGLLGKLGFGDGVTHGSKVLGICC